MPSQDIRSLGPVTITLYGKVFADLIKLKILKWGDYLGLLEWALYAITGILMRGQGRSDIHRAGGDAKVEAETGAIRP